MALSWVPQLVALEADQCLALLATETVGDLVIPGRSPARRRVSYRMDNAAIVLDMDTSPSPADAVSRTARFTVEYDDRDARGRWRVVVRGLLEPAGPESDVAAPAPAERDDTARRVRCRLRPQQVSGRLLLAPLYPTYPLWPELGEAPEQGGEVPAPPLVTDKGSTLPPPPRIGTPHRARRRQWPSSHALAWASPPLRARS